MATTTTKKSSDQLVDILKQIQARKTVRPEDATKALQQYHKVQEHIKALKTDIELFKANQEKQAAIQQDVQTKNQAKGNAVIARKNSIRSQSTAVKQPSPTAKQTSSRILNGSSQTNGTIPLSSRVSRLPTKVSTNDKEIKSQDKQPIKQAAKDEKAKREEKQQSARENSEKDKELARLRMQNAQMKGALETKSNQGPNSISETTAKSSTLEQRDIPTPGKLVVEFKKIFEIEYKTAYHDLEKHYKLKEENITELLAGIAKEAYTFSVNTAKQQFDDVTKAHAHVIDVLVQPKYASQVKDTVTPKSKSIVDKDGYQLTRRYLKDYRRAMARVPIPGLIEIFETIVQRDVLSRFSSLRITPKAARPYIHRLVEINWFMSIHEPPLAQVWPRGGQLMNRDWFTPYGKKGATIIHTVWPALFDHKEGTLAERGICLVK